MIATTTKRLFLLTMAGLLILFMMVDTADARTICGNRSDSLKSLEKGYSEVPVSMGLAACGSVIELFLFKAGTFTIIITKPSGKSPSLQLSRKRVECNYD